MLICAKNSFALTLQLATFLNPASQTWGSCHWRTLTRPGSWPPVSKGKPSVVLKNSFSWKVGTKSQKLDIMQNNFCSSYKSSLVLKVSDRSVLNCPIYHAFCAHLFSFTRNVPQTFAVLCYSMGTQRWSQHIGMNWANDFWNFEKMPLFPISQNKTYYNQKTCFSEIL